MTTLHDASLADIARELRRRAKRTCSHCGGNGLNHDANRESTVTASLACSHCGGSGYELWPELEAAAEQIEALITSPISVGGYSWPCELDDRLPDDQWKITAPVTGWQTAVTGWQTVRLSVTAHVPEQTVAID